MIIQIFFKCFPYIYLTIKMYLFLEKGKFSLVLNVKDIVKNNQLT